MFYRRDFLALDCREFCLSSGDPFTMIPAMGSTAVHCSEIELLREHCNIAAELETFSCFMCEHCEWCVSVSPSALKVETLQCYTISELRSMKPLCMCEKRAGATILWTLEKPWTGSKAEIRESCHNLL